jgi:hypothetical protein
LSDDALHPLGTRLLTLVKSEPTVTVAPHARVPLVATAQGPLEWFNVIVPGAEPATGRNVAHVC